MANLKLTALRERWPLAKREPRDRCQFCDGTGERKTHPGYPCICIFVAHEHCDLAAETLADVARGMRQRLRESKP